MTLEEAVQLLKEAADEKDSEQFKLVRYCAKSPAYIVTDSTAGHSNLG